MPYIHSDPVLDAERYNADMDAEIERLPVCADCGESIQDEEFYIVDGAYYCIDCMKQHLVYTDDWKQARMEENC